MFSLTFVVISTLVAVIILLTQTSKIENLIYLDQYETQDHYRNQPDSWPVTNNSATALFGLRRTVLDGTKHAQV